MHSDSMMTIGRDHTICQDYARHGGDSERVWGILSDGCSVSDNSDIGSRLLVQSAEISVRNGWDHIQQVVLRAEGMSAGMQLNYSALDATLAILSTNKEYAALEARVWGDGLLIALAPHHDSLVLSTEYITPNGLQCPLYPRYLVEEFYTDLWVDTGVRRTDRTYIWDKREGWIEIGVAEYSAREVLDNRVRCVPFPTPTWHTLMFLTDGIFSFTDKSQSPVPMEVVLSYLLPKEGSINGYEGEFVRRRMNGFLRTVGKLGWTHHDDLSAVGITLL